MIKQFIAILQTKKFSKGLGHYKVLKYYNGHHKSLHNKYLKHVKKINKLKHKKLQNKKPNKHPNNRKKNKLNNKKTEVCHTDSKTHNNFKDYLYTPKIFNNSTGTFEFTYIDQIPFKIEVLNDGIDYKNKGLVDSLTKFTKCKLKSGVLFMVEGLSKSSNMIVTKSTYITLDKKEINLHSNTKIDKNSILKSITLSNINKLSKSFKNSNCFDIDSKSFNTLNTIILCANSQKEMIEWIDAILSFKECGINLKYKEMEFDLKESMLKSEKSKYTYIKN